MITSTPARTIITRQYAKENKNSKVRKKKTNKIITKILIY